jgi:glycyl-tRNA synthetase (class II)
MTLIERDLGTPAPRGATRDGVQQMVEVTIDGQTIEDGTVTLRDRDTLEQTRIPADEVVSEIERRLGEPWSPPARS